MPADHEEIEAAEAGRHRVPLPHQPVARDLPRTAAWSASSWSRCARPSPTRRAAATSKPVPGTERVLPCTTLIAAIGQQVQQGRAEARRTASSWTAGTASRSTSAAWPPRAPGVFAGGDCAYRSVDADPRHGGRAEGRAQHRRLASNSGTCASRRARACARSSTQHKMLAADSIEYPVRNEYRVHHPGARPRGPQADVRGSGADHQRRRRLSRGQRCLRCYRIYSVITEQPIPRRSGLSHGRTPSRPATLPPARHHQRRRQSPRSRRRPSCTARAATASTSRRCASWTTSTTRPAPAASAWSRSAQQGQDTTQVVASCITPDAARAWRC